MKQAPNMLKTPRLWALCVTAGIGLLILALTILVPSAKAAPLAHEDLTSTHVSSAETAPLYQGDRISNDYCLACHQEEGLDKTIGNESLPVTINPTQFGMTVHAEEGLVCVDCHINNIDYPHPDVKARSIREYELERYQTCKKCHKDQYELVQDSVHQRAFDEGNVNAAVCTDCHNPHTQRRITGEQSGEITPSARLHIPSTCAQCHSEIYNRYANTIHGKALTEENNTDVPTCIDCHGVHNIQDPRTVTFRNSTPYLCAKCHTDSTIMDKYGISTNVLDTYVADFHGATVKLFEEQFPDQPTNKPVCTDCHGIHEIVKVDDPQAGIALKENLLGKCQRCHPDATTNFPTSWLSHYEPSPEKFPLVYFVNLFYQFFIPAVLGGMTLFVITDIYRRIVNRRKEGTHK